MCESATALYLSVIKRTCNQGANQSNHPNYIPQLFATRTTLHVAVFKYQFLYDETADLWGQKLRPLRIVNPKYFGCRMCNSIVNMEGKRTEGVHTETLLFILIF
jgi:hypothetical protein